MTPLSAGEPGQAAPAGALLGPREVRALAEAGGVRPAKQRGQNFLVDPNTIRSILERAGVSAGQCVLEVGPGLGSLTLGLLERGAHVAAVELDRALAGLLPATLQAHGYGTDRAVVVHQDALALTQLPIVPAAIGAGADGTPTRLVANLPYNVATPILLTLLGRFTTLASAFIMVQAEVADRLVAPPGSRTYGTPSVKTAWYGHAERAGTVSRHVFWPVPHVDSTLVALTRRARPFGDEREREATFAVIDAAFAQRRKMLRSALAPWAGGNEAAREILARAGVAESRRGETLELAEFAAIARARAETPGCVS